MTPFAVWRSRLPASIGTWFARDLAATALDLVEGGRVSLKSVEAQRVTSTVKERSPLDVSIEWATGTGPQALRAVCGCGATGVCQHVIATLESVRTAHEGPEDDIPSPAEEPVDWLPVSDRATERNRARAVWPVLWIDGGALTGSLYLDTPRLRGVLRDGEAIASMMDATPSDDWDEEDRDLVRDDAVRDAFSGRRDGKALARALFRLARHPRLRFDDAPGSNRHPSELPPFDVDPRGVRLRATRRDGRFFPLLERADGTRFSPSGGAVLDGPPSWLVASRGAFLLDGSFDARKVVAAAGVVTNGTPPAAPTPATIARVAPFLTAEDRAALGVVDATSAFLRVALTWREGALLVRGAFVDRAGGGTAVFNPRGSVASIDGRFVRFPGELAREYSQRFGDAGFVPRGSDGWALHDADRAAAFVRETLASWDDVEARLDETLLSLGGEQPGLDVAVHATRGDDGDWFDLDVDVFVDGGQPLSKDELRALLRGSGRYADVRGRLVDVAALRQRSALIAELGDRPRTGLAALVALRDELHEAFRDVALPEEIEALRERLRNFEGIPRIEPPAVVADVLRDYQRRGLDFLTYLASFKFGGVLADDMGVGKTVQVISHLVDRKEKEGAQPALVIAPTSVTHTWEHEIAKFAPELRTLRLASGSDRVARYGTVEDYDVIVTSYALARLDASHLEAIAWRTIILDEAQNAKNPSSQIAKVVRNLRAKHRLALTGTPVENSLRDLWAIMAFVEPGLLGSEGSFRRRFETPIAEGDERAAQTLRSRLEPFVLRRTKEDVAKELPERTESTLEVELSPLQRRLYRGIAEAARRDILEHLDDLDAETTAVHVLAALTRLRQVCAHPGLLLPEHLDDPEASGKFEAFLETVEEVLSGGHKVLVFSSFASMLRIMRTALDKRDIPYSYLDGSTKDKDRKAAVDRFMAPDGPPVFLCSLKAGGVGLTLTAADYVVLYDPWWNPAVERQAIDRTHRIGQTRPVTAYRLVTVGSVEEKIRALAERKAEISRAVVKADSAIAKTLTRDDLAFLFADPPG